MKIKTLRLLIDRAEEILDISISRYGRFCYYYAEEVRKYYWISRNDLKYAIDLKNSNDPEIQQSIYSHWCAGSGREVSKKYQKILKNL